MRHVVTAVNLPTVAPAELPRLQRIAGRKAAIRPTAEAVHTQHMLTTLAACDGNVSEASRCLGVHRRTLQRWLSALKGTKSAPLFVLNCSASARRTVEAERKRRGMLNRSQALDAILEEWHGARLGRDISD